MPEWFILTHLVLSQENLYIYLHRPIYLLYLTYKTTYLLKELHVRVELTFPVYKTGVITDILMELEEGLYITHLLHCSTRFELIINPQNIRNLPLNVYRQSLMQYIYRDPYRIQTYNLQIRNLLLYSIKLRDQILVTIINKN